MGGGIEHIQLAIKARNVDPAFIGAEGHGPGVASLQRRNVVGASSAADLGGSRAAAPAGGARPGEIAVEAHHVVAAEKRIAAAIERGTFDGLHCSPRISSRHNSHQSGVAQVPFSIDFIGPFWRILPPEIGAGADREDAPPAMEALAVSDDPPPSLPRALALKAPPSKLQHGNCGRRHGVV
jgi:hypothetical protein